MLRAVLIDDEQPALTMLRILLARTGRVEIIGEYTKPLEALQAMGKLQPDVVFLDIEMPGTNGLELACRLTEEEGKMDIVFSTAFRQYAVEAFEVNAVDYLLKPVRQEHLERAVSRLLQRRQVLTAVRPDSGGRISCLGKLEVCPVGGAEPVKWRTAKVEELFAYLLYNRGTTVRKGKLIEELWPECEPELADNNLHTSVYRLKKTVKEAGLDITVKLSRGGYVMQLGSGMVYDAEEFEKFRTEQEAVSKENIGTAEKVLGLYQGDYLEGKDYPWCMTERSRLQKEYSVLVKQVAGYYAEAANYAKAQQLLMHNIAIFPYDEEAYEMLLLACFLQRDRIGLIRHFGQLETILQKELGIEPKQSLRRLYESLIKEI